MVFVICVKLPCPQHHGIFDQSDKSKQNQTMAKKSSSSRKVAEAADIPFEETSVDQHETLEPETTVSTKADAAPAKPGKAKASEDTASGGSVGLGDIRKAVAFANSVGGLDKAIALLQIVKVAKEVQ